MKQKNTAGRLWLAGAAALLLLCCAAWYLLSPKAAAGDKTITVTVEHLSSDDRTLTLTTDAEYLSQALEGQSLIAGEDRSYGLYLLTVDGETADEGLQQWWGFTVNGQLGQYGADQQPVTDGDIYVFTLHEGW